MQRYKKATEMCTERTRQELNVHWRTHQELVRALHEHTRQKLMRALKAHMTFEKVPSKHPEHMHLELMHTLSIRISFLRIKIPNFKKSFQNMQSIHVRK
jgi:hypothetical protein